MRCFEALVVLRRSAARGLLLVALGLATGSADAHKSSDSYLQLDAAPHALTLRWDIALRDLDVALDLDSNDDGKLTWAEIKAAWPRIESYALPRLKIDGCELRATGRGLERRNDGAYAVIYLAAPCTLAVSPSIRYSLFAEVDPTHRGLAKIRRPGLPLELTVLDPSNAAMGAPSGTAPGPTAAASRLSGSRWAFLIEGARHILTGYDHILFLICLLLPAVLRRGPDGWRPVERPGQAILPIIGVVSSFTVAHSITLGLAALKIVTLPSWFIDPAIAATIVLAALDNVWPIFPVRRIVVTFCFGLIHGFGFATVLSELNLPTADFALALLQFNVGLELGQLVIVVVATTVLFGLRDWPRYRPVVVRAGSAAAMLFAAIWFVERTANLSILPL